MRGIMLRMVAAFGLVAMLFSGSAFASQELVMQKVVNDAPIVLASGSHNPCGYGDDHGKKTGNPCAENPCNPCGKNPCGEASNPCNPCGNASLDDGRIIVASGSHNACNPCGHNPCAANPCAANACNPCAANPCAANACNPCAKK